MKSKHIAVLCLLFLTGLFAACSESVEETESEAGYPVGSLVLRLRAGSESSTRTQLDGSDAMHHVQEVYAILYLGEGDGATYVSHQKLDWNPMTEGGSNNLSETKEFAMNMPSSKVDQPYTVLCVGLDDKSGLCYSLLNEGMSDLSPALCSGTLADAKAVLNEAGGCSMTEAELFAGCGTFTYSADKANVVSVEMFRRVAGAYAYLKDIPVEVSGKTVKSVRLVLGNMPPKEITLAKKENKEEDYGTGQQTKAESMMLDKVNLADLGAKDSDGNGLYEFTITGLGENLLLLRAYVLPMQAGVNPTLSVELWGGNEGEEDALIKSFPTEWNDAPEGTRDARHYAIYPNYIYHVGTLGTEEDRPMSLAGHRLELVVQPWTTINIATEFPDVPIDASMGYDKNPSTYIYDCINEKGELKIFPSLMKKNWKLTILSETKDGQADPGMDCDWLYFIMPDGTYSQEYNSTDWPGGNGRKEEVTVQFVINDFVMYRDYPIFPQEKADFINNDIRRARFVLQTEESSRSVYLPLKQYNAITVVGTYKHGAISRDYKCGVSRFDKGAKRNSDGALESDGDTDGWGFWQSSFSLVYGGDIGGPYAPDCKPCYDGELCYREAKGNGKGFPGSVIDKGYKAAFEWDGNGNVRDDYYWYLPSRNELYSFFEQIVRYPEIESHVVADELYWSSTAYCDGNSIESLLSSYGQKTSEIELDYHERRHPLNKPFTLGRSRQARKITH